MSNTLSPKQIEHSIINLLTNRGPLRPREVVQELERDLTATEDQVRDVIWSLIDHGRIDPDDRLRLVVRASRAH